VNDLNLGRVGAWSHLDGRAAGEAAAFARRVEELGYGTLWVPETVGREPFVSLALLAAATSGLKLGTSIASIWARDAQAARMSALTLSEATHGRFILGLGVSHPHLAQRLRGHHYDKPLTRMREYLAAYRAAIWKGPMAPEPPILLAALRPRMLELSVTEANGAYPYLVTPARVAEMRAIMDAAAPGGTLAVTMAAVLETDASAARAAARAYLADYLRTPNYQASWSLQGFDAADWEKPGSDRLVDEMIAWGDVATLRERIAAFHAAGADHVAIIPLAPDGVDEYLPVLEALAG
jgi:probable F420-dependent oxidoreductase